MRCVKAENEPREVPRLHYTYNKMFDWTRMGQFRFNEGSQKFALTTDQPWASHRGKSIELVKEWSRSPTTKTVGQSSQVVCSTSVHHPGQP